MYSGCVGGHLNCISEPDHHNYHHHHHGNNSTVLGKRPLLSTAATSAQKKLMIMTPLDLPSLNNCNYSNYPSNNFDTTASGYSQLLPSASFTIAFNQNASEADDQILMLSESNPTNGSSNFQVRAKRGCATHPRSIAERNRRNQISERIKKLQQQLYPDMDKQISTAEILEGAFEYVRSLRIQVEKLRDARAKCKCA